MRFLTPRHLAAAILAALVLIPAGCRSRNKVEPEAAPVEPASPAVSIPAPDDDFVVDRSDEEQIDWSDIDAMNRLAAERGWLRDAFYEFDSSVLSPEARRALADSARWLNENGRYTLLVEGHCDERGTEQYNMALGERRSHAAREYLQSLGVTSSRVRTISLGEERPFEEGKYEESYALNRRAHLRISGTVE